MNTLVHDLPTHFAYNVDTNRYVRTQLPYEVTGNNEIGIGSVSGSSSGSSSGSRRGAMSVAYGHLCYRAYEAQEVLSSHYFGKPHLEALLSLGALIVPSISTIEATSTHLLWAAIYEECLGVLTDQLRDAHDYLGAYNYIIYDTPMYACMCYSFFVLFTRFLTHLLNPPSKHTFATHPHLSIHLLTYSPFTTHLLHPSSRCSS